MITEKIGKHTVEYYSSIDELPVVRFHKWQRAMLVDAGIGSDIASFDRHIERLRIYMAKGEGENAAQELENLRQCVWLIQEQTEPRHLAFAALVSKIDGKKCEDLSDEALQGIVKKLSDAPNGRLAEIISRLKKKIEQELTLYFPKLFEGSEVKEYYGLMRRKTLEALKKIQGQEANIEEFADKLAIFAKPQKFQGSDGVEVQHAKQFGNSCAVFSEVLHLDAKRMTVLEFYNSFELLDERNRENRKKRAK